MSAVVRRPAATDIGWRSIMRQREVSHRCDLRGFCRASRHLAGTAGTAAPVKAGKLLLQPPHAAGKVVVAALIATAMRVPSVYRWPGRLIPQPTGLRLSHDCRTTYGTRLFSRSEHSGLPLAE